MKVNVEQLSDLGRRLSVEVPPETVAAAFDRVYKSIQRDANIKGFRKGKAPLATIKSLYKDKVLSDVVNQLVQEHYTKALDENSLEPINFPQIQVSALDETKSFNFTAEFEIRPDVSLKMYEGLQVEKEALSFDPKYVDSVIENVRNSHARRETVFEDRPATIGDVLVIDFEGERNGQPVPNTQAQDFELELGSKSFIPGFEEGLEGSRTGQDKVLDLTFPEDYHAKDLAGAPITFKVKVKALKKKVLPELNDEFAITLGLESAAKMREVIETDHKTAEEKRINEDLKNRLLKELVAKNPVSVPKSLHQEQKQMLIKDVQNRMKSQGMSDEEFKDYLEKWDQDFNESAAFMIQSSFLINAIAQKENLAATQEDLNAKIDEYAKQTGIEPSKLKGFYNEGDNRSRLMFRITEEKVVDFLRSKAKIKEVSKESLKA